MSITITEFQGSSSEWDALLSQTPSSNLLQSWSYGEAKVNSEHWRVERYLLKHLDEVMGLFQVLIRKRYGMRIVRINRGPLLLDLKDPHYLKSAMLAIRQRWSFRNRCLLLLCPEVSFTDEWNADIRKMRYHLYRSKSWSSATIDLLQPIEVLRKSLDSSWLRNLKKAEKSDLQLQVTDDEESFKWIHRHYVKMVAERGFQGINPSLLRELYAQFKRAGQVILFLASNEQLGKIAFVVLLIHGHSATYLVGWNSEAGRDLRAHHFIFWRAIEYLKEQGISHFDLGGIDEINTPSIARFKRGMGGQEYALLGEAISSW